MIPLWAITGVGAAAIAGAAGFWTAWELQAGAHAKYLVTQADNARATERLRRQNANTAAVAYEKARETVRTEFVTLRERVNVEVEKPVYRNICITADGLQQLTDAARATGYTGQPGKPMPAASAPD